MSRFAIRKNQIAVVWLCQTALQTYARLWYTASTAYRCTPGSLQLPAGSLVKRTRVLPTLPFPKGVCFANPMLPNIPGTFSRFPTRTASTAQVFRNYYFSLHFVKCFSTFFFIFFCTLWRAKRHTNTPQRPSFLSTSGAPVKRFFKKLL